MAVPVPAVKRLVALNGDARGKILLYASEPLSRPAYFRVSAIPHNAPTVDVRIAYRARIGARQIRCVHRFDVRQASPLAFPYLPYTHDNPFPMTAFR
jgi:hypothetical protein